MPVLCLLLALALRVRLVQPDLIDSQGRVASAAKLARAAGGKAKGREGGGTDGVVPAADGEDVGRGRERHGRDRVGRGRDEVRVLRLLRAEDERHLGRVCEEKGGKGREGRCRAGELSEIGGRDDGRTSLPPLTAIP